MYVADVHDLSSSRLVANISRSPPPLSCVALDQEAFQGPLRKAKAAGLRLAQFPVDRFPAGKQFFNHTLKDDYAHFYYPDITVVHNNWIKGHNEKRDRFKLFNLWDVGETIFPSCDD